MEPRLDTTAKSGTFRGHGLLIAGFLLDLAARNFGREAEARAPVENDGRRGDEGSIIGDGDAGGGEGMDGAPSSNDGMSVSEA